MYALAKMYLQFKMKSGTFIYVQVHLNKLECCGKVHLFQ